MILIKYFKKVLANNYWLFIILICYGTIFSLISLLNHYFYRTAALDLGVFNNAIYDYSHFHWNDCMIMQPQFKNILSDHFELLTILVSPLYWVFGTYTMLIAQIIAILWGALGMYKLIRVLGFNKLFSNLSVIHFLSIWGIYSALSFDAHSNVIGTMLLPWFFYYIKTEKWKFSSLYFVLIIISKENIALWTVFICIGLIIIYYKEKMKVRFLSLYAVVALLFFYSVISFIMPALANEGRSYLHFQFDAVGRNFGEAINKIILNPKYAFSLLFESSKNESIYWGIKSELHYMVLLSGGIFLIYRPQFLIMLIPIFAQKLFNSDPFKWGINSHYSIEFVPIITYALFLFINDSKFKYKTKLFIIMISVILCMFSTYGVLDKRRSLYYSSINGNFLTKKHYQSRYNVKKINKYLTTIPNDAKVSASSFLVPHLAMRNYIYYFPDVLDAEYIAIFMDDDYYFFSKEENDKIRQNYLNDSNWNVKINDYPFLLLKKESSLK